MSIQAIRRQILQKRVLTKGNASDCHEMYRQCLLESRIIRRFVSVAWPQGAHFSDVEACPKRRVHSCVCLSRRGYTLCFTKPPRNLAQNYRASSDSDSIKAWSTRLGRPYSASKDLLLKQGRAIRHNHDLNSILLSSTVAIVNLIWFILL